MERSQKQSDCQPKKQKTEHSIQPIEESKQSAKPSTPSITCARCGRDDFSSRNKLFKHLKFCTLDFNPLKRETSQPTEEFNALNNAYIYVTGGRIRGKTLGCVERYSFRTKKWESCPPLLENRGSHGSAALDDVLYVVGGGGFRSNLASNEKLLSCSGSGWSYVRPMPTSRHALAVISAPRISSKDATSSDYRAGDEKHEVIYAVGGWIDGSICSTHLERYCPIHDEWTTCAPMKVGRRLMGATYFGGCIYVFGGNCDDGIWNSDSVEIYNILRDEWSPGAKLSTAGQCSAVTVDDFIYVFIHGHHLLRYCPRSDSFTQLNEELPLKRWFCFDVTTVNKKIYLHGGNVEGVWSNIFFEYDVYRNEWNQLEAMKNDRRRCSATVVYQRINDSEKDN